MYWKPAPLYFLNPPITHTAITMCYISVRTSFVTAEVSREWQASCNKTFSMLTTTKTSLLRRSTFFSLKWVLANLRKSWMISCSLYPYQSYISRSLSDACWNSRPEKVTSNISTCMYCVTMLLLSKIVVELDLVSWRFQIKLLAWYLI